MPEDIPTQNQPADTTPSQDYQQELQYQESQEDLEGLNDFFNDDTSPQEPQQTEPQYYTAEELQQLLEQGQEIDENRLSPEAKVLYSKFLNAQPQEPQVDESPQEPQVPETQIPQDIQLQYQIIEQATNMANEMYKQVFGEEFDRFSATPQQEEMYKTFLNQAKQQVEQQVQAQIQQQTMYENDAKFIQYYAQKVGKDPAEAQRELEALFKPIIEPLMQYQQAMITGDFETAYRIFENLRAKQANIQQQKPQQPINTAETPSAPQVPTQETKDEFQELLEFLS